MNFKIFLLQLKKLSLSAKVAVLFMLFVTLISTIQLINQLSNFEIQPFGFLDSLKAIQDIKSGKTNKGGQNIGSIFDATDADVIFGYEKSAGINNGFTVNIVNSMDDLGRAIEFSTRAMAEGKITFIRFCVNNGFSNCNFPLANQTITESHPIVKFCVELGKVIPKNFFICSTGPNEPTAPYEHPQFGYPNTNSTASVSIMDDIALKSLQLARILKTIGIQTSTYSIDLARDNVPDLRAYLRRSSSIGMLDVFDYVAYNLYDLPSAESYETFLNLNISDNNQTVTPKSFAEKMGAKVIITEFGGMLADRGLAFDTLKKNAALICSEKIIAGVNLFRSSVELLGPGGKYAGLIPDGERDALTGGRRIWPHQWNANELKQILDPCNNIIIKETEQIENYEIFTDAERCTVMNPITNSPYNLVDDCSNYFGSKLGINQGHTLNGSMLNIYRGNDTTKPLPNLHLGATMVLGVESADAGNIARAVIDANKYGYLPVVRFCFIDQNQAGSNIGDIECDLNYDLNSPASFAKVCESIYQQTEAEKARFVCLVGPNEPGLEWGAFKRVTSTYDLNVFIQGANSNAQYLQKYRDRMFLAPAAFNVSSCGVLDEVKSYLHSGNIMINPSLFDYLVGNIYTQTYMSAYDQFSSADICGGERGMSLKSYVEKHNLKFILSEFGKWEEAVSNNVFEQDIINFCKEPTVDYFLFFKQLYFKFDLEPFKGATDKASQDRFKEIQEKISKSILTPDKIREFAAMCPKNQPTVDFSFNTVIYEVEPIGIDTSVKSKKIPMAPEYEKKISADLLLNCNSQICRYNGTQTIRINTGIKSVASLVSNKFFNLVSLPSFNTMNIGEYEIDPQAKFSVTGSIDGKLYTFPYLGSLLNQANLLPYNFVYQDPDIQSLYVHPASLRSNVDTMLKAEKERDILKLAGDVPYFFGHSYESSSTGEKFISNQNFIYMKSVTSGAILNSSNVLFNTEKNTYRPYDPLLFDTNKFLKKVDDMIVYSIPDNYIVGPELVIGDFSYEFSSIDVCYQYSRRNLANSQIDPKLKFFGIPDCKFIPTKVFFENQIKKTCNDVRTQVCSEASILNGTCNSREDYFKICIEFMGMKEGNLYYNTENFAQPESFTVDGVMESLYKIYQVINKNLYNKGLRLNTGDNILALDAQSLSYIRDKNRSFENLNTKPSKYMPIDTELSYVTYDPLKPETKINKNGETADLFQNNIPLARMYEAKEINYAIPYLGFFQVFTELLTVYNQNSYLPTIEKPDSPLKITNPFYKNPDICQKDVFLCNKKNIYAPNLAEIFMTIPIFTCDAYHIRANYSSKSELMSMLRTLNLSSNPLFEKVLDSIFQIPKLDKRYPCLEPLDMRYPTGVLEKELCKRGFIIEGACEAKCNTSTSSIDNSSNSNELPSVPASWTCDQLKCSNLNSKNGVPYPACRPEVLGGFCDDFSAMNVLFGNGDPKLPIDTTMSCDARASIIGNAVRPQLTSVYLLGRNVVIHKKLETIFKKIEREIQLATINGNSFSDATYYFPSGTYTFINGGTFNAQAVRKWVGSSDFKNCTISNHTFGTAIDLNVATNGYQSNSCKLDMPPEVVQIFEANGFRWGGRYPKWSNFDPMHFEYCRGDTSQTQTNLISTPTSSASTTTANPNKFTCLMPTGHNCFQGPTGFYSHCGSDTIKDLPVDFYPAFTNNRNVSVVAPENGKVIKSFNYSNSGFGNLGRSLNFLGESGILYYIGHLSNDTLHKNILSRLAASSNGVYFTAGSQIGNLCTRGPNNSTSDADGYCMYDYRNIHVHTHATIAGNVIDPYMIYGNILGCKIEPPDPGMTARTVLKNGTNKCAAYVRDSSGKIQYPILNDLACVDKKPKSKISLELLTAITKNCNVADASLQKTCNELRSKALSGQKFDIGSSIYSTVGSTDKFYPTDQFCDVNSISSTDSELTSEMKFENFNKLVATIAKAVGDFYNSGYPPELLKATITIETSLVTENRIPYGGDPLLKAWTQENSAGASGPAQFLEGPFMKAISKPAFEKCLDAIGIKSYNKNPDLRNYLGPALCAAAVKQNEDIKLANKFLPNKRSDWYVAGVSARDTRALSWCKPLEKYPEKSNDKSDLCQKYDVLPVDKITLIELAGRRYYGACFTSVTSQMNNGFNYCETILRYSNQYKSEF
jgi:hypothetical protein